ncbi:MAG: hypothetical protein L6R30_00635 [Thermoanaerobaculia bacterium]|nr:hypothetical protein [Thermoanaerobaculia bacterium]
MKETSVAATLTPKEWRLIESLRAIPESPLKRRVDILLEDLLEFIREPKCPEMQADGVPCTNVHANCDQCTHVTEMVDYLAISELVSKKPQG